MHKKAYWGASEQFLNNCVNFLEYLVLTVSGRIQDQAKPFPTVEGRKLTRRK